LLPEDVQALFSMMTRIAGELEEELEGAEQPAPVADENRLRQKTVPP